MIKKQSVAVIDYGMGNLHSVGKALQHADPQANVLITADKAEIKAADRVVFPGVGAMRDCMAHLQGIDLVETIKEVSRNKPFLGICLGMQALLSGSEENATEVGATPCLDIFSGVVKAFPSESMQNQGLKVPHMGWNQVAIASSHTNHPVWQGIKQHSRFYFVHSYYAQAAQAYDVSATCHYGQEFACVLAKDNLFAVQFHPEKSHDDGLKLLHNFLHWDGEA